MTPQKFREIEALCQSVRQHGAEVLLNVDPETRELVQSLLEQDPSLPTLLSGAETVALSIQAPVGIGTQLGPYKIEAVLGAGGMGQVFRAIDTRLARSVAIKTSNERFTERFEREARTIAALNHPCICTVHDVGPNYLVMELVEGETIATRLKKGKLSISDTLRYGIQIAEALAAAHGRGITHRDLKPGNVMITKSGVKVLDFGLAKSSHDDSLTATNVAMGTPAYMAPEQREAKECDARTDLYALGLVLFEMATGKRPVHGAPIQLESLPERLAHVVELCLVEDPDQRWQDAQDVKVELEWAAIIPAPAKHSAHASRVWPAFAGLLILSLGGLAFVHFRESAPQQTVVHSTVLPPDKASFAFATNLGPMSLSPNGKGMVFAATGQDGKSQLWIRSLDSASARLLQGTDSAMFPFWSPDSLWVAFFADGKLKKIDTRGGSPVALAEASNGYGGSWSGRGVIVFAPTIFAPLLKISQDGGTATPVMPYTGGNGFPWFLPDGEHFLFGAWGGSGHMVIRLGSLSSTDSTTVGETDSNAIYAGGRLLYLRGNSLMAQPFDMNSLRTNGDAEPIAEGVQRFLDLVSVGAFSASSTGLLAYQTGLGAAQRQLTSFDRTGNPMKPLGDPRAFFSIELSPDGRSLVASAPDALGNYDLWLYDVARNLQTRLTSDPGGEYYGVWSPDGKNIIFNSTRRNGHYDLYRKPANGTGAEELIYADDTGKVPTSWSPDGKLLLYFTGGGPRHEIWLLPLTPARPGEALKPVRFLKTGFNEIFAQFSPDGRWVAYGSDDSGQSEIYMTSFSQPSQRHQISASGGAKPRWRRDGRELYYIGLDGRLMGAEVRISEGNVEVGQTHALFSIGSSSWSYSTGYPYEVSPDGTSILTAIAGDGAIQPVTLVQNWTAIPKK